MRGPAPRSAALMKPRAPEQAPGARWPDPDGPRSTPATLKVADSPQPQPCRIGNPWLDAKRCCAGKPSVCNGSSRMRPAVMNRGRRFAGRLMTGTRQDPRPSVIAGQGLAAKPLLRFRHACGAPGAEAQARHGGLIEAIDLECDLDVAQTPQAVPPRRGRCGCALAGSWPGWSVRDNNFVSWR